MRALMVLLAEPNASYARAEDGTLIFEMIPPPPGGGGREDVRGRPRRRGARGRVTRAAAAAARARGLARSPRRRPRTRRRTAAAPARRCRHTCRTCCCKNISALAEYLRRGDVATDRKRQRVDY